MDPSSKLWFRVKPTHFLLLYALLGGSSNPPRAIWRGMEGRGREAPLCKQKSFLRAFADWGSFDESPRSSIQCVITLFAPELLYVFVKATTERICSLFYRPRTASQPVCILTHVRKPNMRRGNWSPWDQNSIESQPTLSRTWSPTKQVWICANWHDPITQNLKGLMEKVQTLGKSHIL